MSNKDDTQQQTTPILRLRDKTPTELNTPRISPHPRDGPWMRDPSGLTNELRVKSSDKRPVVGVTMDEFRAFSKVERESALRHLKKLKAEKRLGEMKIIFFATMWRSVDMMRTEGWTDDEIESALEKYYTGAQQYVAPTYPRCYHVVEPWYYCDPNSTKLPHAQQYRGPRDD